MGALFLTSCGTPSVSPGNYRVSAHRPHDPSAVRVKVSLSKQNVYVMEGDRCLMAVATTVGIPAKPTPKGNFTIYSKQEHKRSGSYGFRVQGDRIIPAEAGASIPGNYVGYPMGYWCEFSPAYGFHQGFVHLQPRSHGCLRLKGEAAPRSFGGDGGREADGDLVKSQAAEQEIRGLRRRRGLGLPWGFGFRLSGR